MRTLPGVSSASPPPFVLIHGSWHGGWCWERLAPLLEERGHRVLAPTLIGLGALAHLARPETGLAVHADQVAALLRDEDVHDAVLVGHSYGGMILTASTEQEPDRIASLVYLDALIPAHGQSAFDLMPGVEDGFQAGADAVGDGWLVPPMDAAEFGIADPVDAAWVNERLTPMPIRTHREKVAAPRDLARSKKRAFIFCERSFFGGFAEHAAADGFDVVTSVDAGHDVQLTHPAELRGILTRLT